MSTLRHPDDPTLAKRALTADEDVALMLPCPVVICARDAGSTLKIAGPSMIASFFETSELRDVAATVEAAIVAAARDAV